MKFLAEEEEGKQFSLKVTNFSLELLLGGIYRRDFLEQLAEKRVLTDKGMS